MTSVIVLFGIVCVLWLAYLVRPFLRTVAGASDVRERLEEEKRGLLLALRDAELDHAAGRLSAEDYSTIREGLEVRTATVMRELDAYADAPASGLDQALARVRGARPAASTSPVQPGAAPTTEPEPSQEVPRG